MGRPPVEIDWEDFDKLVRLQCTKEEIAAWFDCSLDTIENKIRDKFEMTFSAYRDQKAPAGRASLRRYQWLAAQKGNVAMLIWLGKNWLGQTDKVEVAQPTPEPERKLTGKISFEQFCENAGYPQPFLKQLEMKEFVFDNPKQDPRLILGARGYGKTDYITILGVAYQIYLNPHDDTTLIVTKSRDRNASILSEIRTACEKNGVTFERANASRLRVEGLIGKDDSVSAVTIKSVSLRGRHPKRVILDDPVTPDDKSEATRKQVKRIYDEIVKLTKNVSIIGQPVHKLDLYQNLRPLVQKMEVPYGSIPELDADLEAQRMAGVDEASIQASYFLNIVSDGSTPFENIKYIDEMPIEPGKNTVAFIDPAFGGTDYTAITIMCGYMQGVAVVGFAWQRSWEHCLDEIVELCERYNVGRMAFETNKTGEQPLDVIRTALKVRNLRLGLVGIWSNTNKHSRIMAAGTYAHLIHLCKRSNQAYTDQTIQYEQGAKNDDAPDSLASCMTWLGLIRGKENKGER